MEAYSSMEYVVSSELLDRLASFVFESERAYFLRRSQVVGEGQHYGWREITRRAPIDHRIESELRRAVKYSSVNSLLEYILKINCTIGGYFKDGSGFRGVPILVWSRECPWASFVVPDSNPRTVLSKGIDRLIDLSGGLKNIDLFIIGMSALLVLSHPFVDCNGRTMRLMLYKMLRDLKHLNECDAMAYACFWGCTKESFVQVFYDLRVSDEYLHLTKMFY